MRHIKVKNVAVDISIKPYLTQYVEIMPQILRVNRYILLFVSDIMDAVTSKGHRKRHGHHKVPIKEENIELDEFPL